MHLIALLIGLIIERLATQFFHLRRLRWLERLIDRGLQQAERLETWPSLIPIIALAILLVLPVVIVTLSLGDALLGFPYLILCIVVLFFSLGPKDIGEDVDDYCAALQSEDEEKIRQTAKAIVESDVPTEALERCECVEAAVVVQANNRLFAVIFWFVLLGPLGAWGYRVTDLIRRRTVFTASRDEQGVSQRAMEAAETLHGWLAWIPARLTAIGYATAGHFDAALAAWRAMDHSSIFGHEGSERLLATVGVGALDLQRREDESPMERGVAGATAANKLVFRLLMIWAFIIAAMTLYGWTL
ncbi:MAG: regulatory signaling modulator protein AmpE [Woeseiaceae bacterium]|nr:regulatory signaling modulator protein AmpE [Woeseiaceae bacterium]